MKKIKIMLLSFALLAIVGAALAFKVSSAIPYCTAQVNDANHRQFGLCTVAQGVNKTCPSPVISTTQNAIVSFCYTTPSDFANDGVADQCDDNGANTLICDATTNLKVE